MVTMNPSCVNCITKRVRNYEIHGVHTIVPKEQVGFFWVCE
jgi:hypothetical protein